MKKFLDRFNLTGLYGLAFTALFFHSLILTFANSIGYKTTSTGLIWNHWFGFFGWAVPTVIGYRLLCPGKKPYAKFLFPTASLLSGIGILSIWRINAGFGFRQMIIYAFSVLLISAALHKGDLLEIIRKRGSWILFFAIALLFSTLVFGVNPGGYGPSLWIGCCGIYFQPSEPLKIILLVVLAYYLPAAFDPNNGWKKLVWVIGVPLVILSILLVQKDLGTGSIFLILIIAMVAIHLQKPIILTLSAVGMLIAGIVGYTTIPIIQTRIDIWLHPWNDPSNTGYQIIQSLISIANGGLNGRGPGLGYPTLVPVAFSDFIFTAITEEHGLVGALLILAFIAGFVFLAFSIAKTAKREEQALLAAGIGVYIGAQSIVIIGGNINLMPLTGVTLPFISYGGSSLFSSYVALGLLLAIAKEDGHRSTVITNDNSSTKFWLAEILFVGLVVCGITLGYWSLIKSPDLLSRTDNARRALNDLYSKRGSILDRNNQVLVSTDGDQGNYVRRYHYSFLTPILGYNHPTFGQANIEASYDPYLRGERGQPDLNIWWNHLTLGRPPDGLNIRSTLDISLEEKLLALFDGGKGAALLVTPRNGEIIGAVSVPYADLNNEESYLLDDEQHGSPLLNRVSLGKYPTELVSRIFAEASIDSDLPDSIAQILYERGVNLSPTVGFETSGTNVNTSFVSPLQLAKLFSSFSNDGTCSELQFISAVENVEGDWVILPTNHAKTECFSRSVVDTFTTSLQRSSRLFWSAYATMDDASTTLYIAGTNLDWTGTPLVMVVVFEGPTSASSQELDKVFRQLLLNK